MIKSNYYNNKNELNLIQNNNQNLCSTKIFWYKDNKNAKIPSKRAEDAGYDIYTVEDNIWLKPHQTRLFDTGIHYSIEGDIWLKAADRGSTGSKGIHTHCGICDQGYRGNIFIALNNTNNYPVLFTSKATKVELKRTWYGRKYLVYPTSKGIAQLIPMPLINPTCTEVNEDEWNNKYLHNSERGNGALGSSGK